MSTEIKMTENIVFLDKEEYDVLPTVRKELYMKSIIEKMLKNSENGITVSNIQKITDFSRTAILRHLDTLVATNQAYFKIFGQVRVYYPNGKLVHPAFSSEIEIGNKTYCFNLLKNSLGEFLYIQEKKEDKYNKPKVTGGLLIKKEGFDEFISALLDLKERFHNKSKI